MRHFIIFLAVTLIGLVAGDYFIAGNNGELLTIKDITIVLCAICIIFDQRRILELERGQ